MKKLLINMISASLVFSVLTPAVAAPSRFQELTNQEMQQVKGSWWQLIGLATVAVLRSGAVLRIVDVSSHVVTRANERGITMNQVKNALTLGSVRWNSANQSFNFTYNGVTVAVGANGIIRTVF